MSWSSLACKILPSLTLLFAPLRLRAFAFCGATLRRQKLRRLLAALALAACLPAVAAAREPWADPELPQVEGLVLWLDASHEAAARKAAGQAEPKSGDSLAVWHDGSGAKRHARQPDAERQPRLVQIGSQLTPSTEAGWAVRFDGDNDCLRVLENDQRLTDFTLFLVAAPHSNVGGYRAFFAVNQQERRDYETGFNVDMNAPFSAAFQNLNVEGRGFGGARNLLTGTSPFGRLHVVEIAADLAGKQVRLALDGKAGGQRPFAGGELIADEITIGARHYENGPGAQRVQGFLHGDIAEVLLFDRALSSDEAKSVREYLDRKYAAMREALPRELRLAAAAEGAEPLVPVENPPLVQMFVPGFAVEEVPVELTNINNLRYRPDGKCYALGYDGNVWLLSDTSGDGMPDAKSQFFENRGRLRGPIGMAVIPPGHALLANAKDPSQARGVVVPSKGKVSALLDLDGDDVAEEERIIATGWQEIPQNIDANGVAIHPADGAIYFGLGTANFANGYLVDAAGKSAFDLKSERGTIQRIEPDLSGRQTVCTGVRFIIGMQFDADGELFVTDQEGATWLPNGNPLDELLHIRPDRHYGFPPRHPRHLPHVFDEPSLFDYGPQHQSTCGLALNLPLKDGGPIFGPDRWRGNAIVCGEARGKLYRTEIVKTESGEYVARNHLIGSLGMLTVDCTLTPWGDLLVACHSGGPDWGTGPSGIGKLFRIRYRDRQAPQPVTAWAAGPQEVRIAFDRPLDPELLKDLASQAKITYGEYVSAGDRFETLRPGYAVVQMQLAAPRFNLPVYSASVTPDRRTLILATAPHPAAVHYAITLPSLARAQAIAPDRRIAQHPQIDLAYSLSGVLATWQPRDESQAGWTGWLPHLDLNVAKALVPQDAELEKLWKLIEQPGTLTLKTQFDPRGLFTPAVQPLSKLDYDPADDRWIQERTLRLASNVPLAVSTSLSPDEVASAAAGDAHQAAVKLGAEPLSPLSLTVKLQTGGSQPSLSPAWVAKLGDDAVRSGPVALHRFVLPWAELKPESLSLPQEREIPELAGASWGRGRQVFLSEEAACSKCHVAHGTGGQIGPDLSNLVHRDYASVLRDITQPSFAINPDYITYNVRLSDGRVLTGAVRSEGEKLLVGDKDGKVTEVRRDDVEQMQPSAISVMPEEIAQKLGPERMKDLLAYLLLPAPQMPQDARLPPPPPRKLSEVEAALAGSQQSDGKPKPIHVLLVAGAKDHGPGEHDYPAWLRAWSELLAAAEGMTVSTAMEWPTDEQLQAADTIVFYQKGSWNADRAKAIDAHLAKGGGLVYIHWAVEAGPEAPAFAQRIGLASNGPRLKFRHGPLDLGFETGRGHPISRNFDRVHFYDESYWLLQGDASRVRVLATGVEEGDERPLFWTLEPGGGRVFVSILGHYSWTFDDPLFRILLLRGIAWSAREPVDRFNELVLLGVVLRDSE